ncbi:MAG: hypothetical protein E7633_03850 [Ruminococcaceae bacterium]|nr:hypothetical protein [Oscillospiraceae bacterium]
MKRRWTKEEAWEFWNKNPWIVGCNWVPAETPGLSIWQGDTIEEILPSARKELALMQEVGFNTVRMRIDFNLWYHERDVYLDRVDRILDIMKEYGIKLMPVLFSDCVSFGKPADTSIPMPRGKGRWAVGYHGGRPNSPHVVPTGKPIGWVRWDEEDQRPICEQFIRDLARRFGKDDRIILWDIWNEPGNSKRGDMSIPYLKRAFEIAREEDVMQPLTAGVWTYPKNYGVDESLDVSPIQRVALDLSDIISFHNYENFEEVKNCVKALEKEGRPMANTEWLHRILGNTVEDQLPFYYEKKIGSTHWGLVAGHGQFYLPWEWLKAARPELDFTLWQHDIFREDHTPYDEKEIELFKKLCANK